MPFSLTTVAYASRLPAVKYSLEAQSGIVSPVHFSVGLDGTVGIDSAPSLLRVESFHGQRRLGVTGPVS
jgi:hypothetical protein